MPTIDGALRATARRIPDAEALKFGQVELNYAQLDEAVDRAARALAGLGLTKGDRVALMSTNSHRFVIAFYASQRLGAILVPVNPSSAPQTTTPIFSPSRPTQTRCWATSRSRMTTMR